MRSVAKLRRSMGPLARALLFGFGLAAVALAHGGGLDKNGCHTNKKTGEYHCHGTPAAAPPPAPRGSTPAASSGSTSQRNFISIDAPAGSAAITERQLVLSVQFLLKSLGYALPKPDGALGAETVAAIRKFQQDDYLEVDGRATGQLLVRIAEEVSRKN